MNEVGYLYYLRNKIAIAICLIAALLEAIVQNWFWVAADIIIAALNAKLVYDDGLRRCKEEEINRWEVSNE